MSRIIFSLDLSVSDEQQLIAAARDILEEVDTSDGAFEALFAKDGLVGCARLVMDGVVDLPGLEVVDTTCESSTDTAPEPLALSADEQLTAATRILKKFVLFSIPSGTNGSGEKMRLVREAHVQEGLRFVRAFIEKNPGALS
jgi:hypothetical protein